MSCNKCLYKTQLSIYEPCIGCENQDSKLKSEFQEFNDILSTIIHKSTGLKCFQLKNKNNPWQLIKILIFSLTWKVIDPDNIFY